jgi:hypothetical protein
MLTYGIGTEAVVVEKYEASRLRGTGSRLVFYEFVDTHGTSFSGATTGSDGFFEAVEVGDEVRVLYDPSDPSDNETVEIVRHQATLPEMDIGGILAGLLIGSVLGVIVLVLLSRLEKRLKTRRT